MTKDEAFNKLVECVDKVDSGKFRSVEHALVAAAQALNYIMDEIDNGTKEAPILDPLQEATRQTVEALGSLPTSKGSNDDDVPLSASQIRKEAGVTPRDQQIARQAAKEGTDDNPSS